ncbi:MAG: hypothetical protein R2747_06290 [Pyrinomonadaceae bacterium]
MKEKDCPKCGWQKLKTWNELTEEQKMLAKKLPLNVKFSPFQRRKHIFCSRCWFEFVPGEDEKA